MTGVITRILDKIDSMNGYVHVDSFIGELKRFIEQLNQPKEEGKE